MYANIIIHLYKCQELYSLLSKRLFFRAPCAERFLAFHSYLRRAEGSTERFRSNSFSYYWRKETEWMEVIPWRDQWFMGRTAEGCGCLPDFIWIVIIIPLSCWSCGSQDRRKDGRTFNIGFWWHPFLYRFHFDAQRANDDENLKESLFAGNLSMTIMRPHKIPRILPKKCL